MTLNERNLPTYAVAISGTRNVEANEDKHNTISGEKTVPDL